MYFRIDGTMIFCSWRDVLQTLRPASPRIQLSVAKRCASLLFLGLALGFSQLAGAADDRIAGQSNDEDEVVVRDSAQLGREIRIATDEILEEVPAKSLMPAGLADQLADRGEFLDLVKFVSVLGKPGPYANDESPVIRKWQVANVALGNAYPPADAQWKTAYSMVNGLLPAGDLLPEDSFDRTSVFARGFVDVLAAGPVRLELNSFDGLKVWVDDQPVTDLSAPISLDRGQHSLTFRIVGPRVSSGLRVELIPESRKAKIQPLGGQSW